MEKKKNILLQLIEDRLPPSVIGCPSCEKIVFADTYELHPPPSEMELRRMILEPCPDCQERVKTCPWGDRKCKNAAVCVKSYIDNVVESSPCEACASRLPDLDKCSKHGHKIFLERLFGKLISKEE